MVRTRDDLDGRQRRTAKDRVTSKVDAVQGSQAWGSIFRTSYSDCPRNRPYAVMNSALHRLHPVKVKRHAANVSHTLCLGGLSSAGPGTAPRDLDHRRHRDVTANRSRISRYVANACRAMVECCSASRSVTQSAVSVQQGGRT